MSDTLSFDHYEVLTRADGSPFELGRGAMGITYKAFDKSLRIPVALKVINGTYLDSEVARQRFIREARSAAKLRHRNVASVFHLGVEGDAYFYAMEFIDGETVDALIKRQGPLQPAIALQIAAHVARALNAAQPHGLVHRDIKPSNLMLVREDDELVAKVIDFGLAKSYLPEEGAEDAATLSIGGFVGTPHFASPEQLDEQVIDVRSDIYSLGVTLWYMLSGQTPFAGSMAQVMSQHLSKAPPFAQLSDLPPPVAALLGRMLEKDPAKRQQTPNELRRELEDCLQLLSQSPSLARPTAVDEENYATVLDEPAKSETLVLSFEVGATLDNRYKILEDLGETNTGRLFRATEVSLQRDVRLLVLKAELSGDAGIFTQIETEVEQTAKAVHPNLLQVYGLETLQRSGLITMEWTNGFSLHELLRTRRELNVSEVMALLPQAAAAIDHALALGLNRLDLTLQQTFLHFDAAAPTKGDLLRSPLGRWPEFALKLNPLGITRELAQSATWAGRQTIVGGMAAAKPGTENHRTRYIQALAKLVYELLGGSFAAAQRNRDYTPLATLSEQGNEVLRQALDTERSFPSASAFQKALETPIDLEPKRHEPKPASQTVSKAPTAPNPAPQLAPAPSPQRAQPAPPPAPRPAGSKGLLIAGISSLLVLGLAGYWFTQHGKSTIKPGPGIVDNPPTTVTPTEVAPPPEPPPSDPTPPKPPEVVKTDPPPTDPAPADPTPTPPVEPPPPEPPKPSRAELLKVALKEANALELKEVWPQTIRQWLNISEQFGERESAKVHLEIIINQLRKRSEEVNAREFSELKEPVIAATQLEVVAAMMFLGDNLRKTDQKTSFNWFQTAADHGDVAAITQVGLMLANGESGTPVNLTKAFELFKDAADKGDVGAKYLLGECYLRGNGVKKDEKRAIAILTEAADAGNMLAMDMLGSCYHRGMGVPKDYAKAIRLFTQASEAGYGVAMGNLGALYMNGDGLPKPDPQKALDWFQKGISAGDRNCMFFYARCLEEGRGVGANLIQAQSWYIKAAEAGNKPAADWCARKGIPFIKPR